MYQNGYVPKWTVLCTEIAHHDVPKLSSQNADVPKTTSTVLKTTSTERVPPYVPKWTCTKLDLTLPPDQQLRRGQMDVRGDAIKDVP